MPDYIWSGPKHNEILGDSGSPEVALELVVLMILIGRLDFGNGAEYARKVARQGMTGFGGSGGDVEITTTEITEGIVELSFVPDPKTI